MIVKTDAYTREQIGKVVQMRANVEGLKLSSDVVDKLAGEGEKSSLRLVFLRLGFVVTGRLIPFNSDTLFNFLHLPLFWRPWLDGSKSK